MVLLIDNSSHIKIAYHHFHSLFASLNASLQDIDLSGLSNFIFELSLSVSLEYIFSNKEIIVFLFICESRNQSISKVYSAKKDLR
jgi:hypothetical protein